MVLKDIKCFGHKMVLKTIFMGQLPFLNYLKLQKTYIEF